MKKVLIITYYWPPSGGPGVQRCVKFAKLLPEFGYEPIIVTVDPDQASYPLIDPSLLEETTSIKRVYKTKTSEPFKYYTKLIPNANIPNPGFSNESNPGVLKKLSRFIRGNLYIPDARIGWNQFALRQCSELIRKERITALITSSPPHSTQLIGMKLSQSSGIPWIADLRDPWTDIYYNKNLFRLRFAKIKDARFERMVLEKADRIVTTSESTKKLFQSKSEKINPDKMHVIPNGFDSSDFPEKQENIDTFFSITYTGTMSDDYPVLSFIKSVEPFLLLKSSNKIRIDLVGEVSGKIKELFFNSKISHLVKKHGYLSHSNSIEMMQKASVLLLIIPDVPNNEGIIPGKLFEYLAAHRPIINFGNINSDASKIIAKCNSGRTFSYGEIDMASKYLIDLYIQWSQGSEMHVGNRHIKEYSRQEQTRMLAHIIDNLA